MSINKIDIFIKRLKKLNIDIELVSNYPWIYLYKVNGNIIKEKFHSDYGFTIAFLPVRINLELNFTDISKMFEIIRKYL